MQATPIPPAYAALANAKYVSLTTYRKSGVPVSTPLWFVLNASGVFVETSASAGKVKRIRANAQVEIVPCKASGTPTGPAIPATASIIPSDQATQVNRALVARYGVLKRFVNLFVRLRHTPQVVIRVVPRG